MKNLKIFLIALLPVFYLFPAFNLHAGSGIQDLGKPGTKTAIGKGLTLTYSFNVHPAMGMVILKVRVTDKDGNPEDGISLTGISDMPEMQDSNSGKVKFVQNKKKDFLFPINVTMPGKWQVTVVAEKKKKAFFTGIINFNV
jgi:hypothetical protein